MYPEAQTIVDESEGPAFTTIDYSTVNSTLDDYSEPDATENGNVASAESLGSSSISSEQAAENGQTLGSRSKQDNIDDKEDDGNVTIAYRRHTYPLYLPY